MGTLKDFEAVPGFGLKCHVSNIDHLLKSKTDMKEYDSVNSYIDSKFNHTEFGHSI